MGFTLTKQCKCFAGHFSNSFQQEHGDGDLVFKNRPRLGEEEKPFS